MLFKFFTCRQPTAAAEEAVKEVVVSPTPPPKTKIKIRVQVPDEYCLAVCTHFDNMCRRIYKRKGDHTAARYSLWALIAKVMPERPWDNAKIVFPYNFKPFVEYEVEVDSEDGTGSSPPF